MAELHNHREILNMKVLNTNIMKLLGPLITKQYFDGDLDLG